MPAIIAQWNTTSARTLTDRIDLERRNMKLTIALMQLLPADGLERQYEKAAQACQKAKALGADIALFPEMWSCGYRIPERLDELRALATPAEGEWVAAFGDLACRLEMAVGITFLEQFDPLPRNSLALFDRRGVRRLLYAKAHTCDFGDEARLTPGGRFETAELDTAQGPIQVGAMICYDREFPESARILMLKGAELILVPNACPMEINRISQLRGRAYENMAAIATVNYPKGQPDCNGHSTVFDGIAYRPEEAESRDTLILETGEKEGIYRAEIPIEEIRLYRSREVHGNAYRHPKKYGLLIDTERKEPFIREDYRP